MTRLVTLKDGCSIHVSEHGSGSPILFIPGLGGAASFWDAVVPHFSDSYRTIAVDHRGAGRSDRPEGPYSIELIAADSVEILGHLGLERVHVVGHSTGGRIAQTIALQHPERVDHLVISGSWDVPDARFELLFRTRLQVLQQAGPAAYQNLTHALGFPADWIATHGAELAQAVFSAAKNLAPLPVTIARILMLLEQGDAPDLARITAPTLVIGAPDDALVPFYHSQHLADAIPGARLEALPGAHFFPRVHPQRFAALVRAFLEAKP